MLEELEVNPYLAPSSRLGDVCKDARIEWETLVDKVNALPVPARDSDWTQLPISHLLDFLTQEHRDYVDYFIPAIQSGFASGEGRTEFVKALNPMIKAWPEFSASLMEHVAAEETYLFPKILRYAYCAEHHRTDPDFSDGSVKVFAAVQLLRNEEKQMDALSGFLEAAAFTGAMEPSAVGLLRLLHAFRDRLLEHSRMERDVLYPMAADLEKRLYDAYIQGNPVFSR